MQEVVFPNEMMLRGGVILVEVGQHADGWGGVGGEEDGDVLLRERRRETFRKFGGCGTIFGMVYDRLRGGKNKKADSLRRRYSRAGLEEVLKGEEGRGGL